MLRQATHLNCNYIIYMSSSSASVHAKIWHANLKIRFTTEFSNINVTHTLSLESA